MKNFLLMKILNMMKNLALNIATIILNPLWALLLFLVLLPTEILCIINTGLLVASKYLQQQQKKTQEAIALLLD